MRMGWEGVSFLCQQVFRVFEKARNHVITSKEHEGEVVAQHKVIATRGARSGV